MNSLTVTPFPALRDNYIWLVHGTSDSSRVAIVDPGEAEPLFGFLQQHALRPEAVLVTHHHPDHTGGVRALADYFNIPVYGPAREASHVVTHPLHDGARVQLPGLGLEFAALDIPGHTLGHIALHGHGAVFSGDTLFSAGCGRLFEGNADQMLASLERLAALPEETRVYCGHEYTAANLAFAATVDPHNESVRVLREEVASLNARRVPTLPSTIGQELSINPFLRTSESAVRRAAEQWSGTMLNDKVRVFAALRRWKDSF